MSGICPVSPTALASYFCSRLQFAHRLFLGGLLLTEEPLMSHVCLSGNFTEVRWIGTSLVVLNSQPAIMHRRGKNRTADKFGCDLAWTVRVFDGGAPWIKTCFLQLKMIDPPGPRSGPRVELDKQQLANANRRGFWERAFMVGVYPDQPVAFASPMKSMPSFKGKKKTVQCAAPQWSPFDTWLRNWLMCVTGEFGSPPQWPLIDAASPLEDEIDSPRIRLRIDTDIRLLSAPQFDSSEDRGPFRT